MTIYINKTTTGSETECFLCSKNGHLVGFSNVCESKHIWLCKSHLRELKEEIEKTTEKE